MNFNFTVLAELPEGEVLVSAGNDFRHYCQDVEDFIDIQNPDNIEYLKRNKAVLEDLVVLSLESTISNMNCSLAVRRDNLVVFIDSFIDTLEDEQEYEVCNAFLKIKNEFNALEK